MILPQVKFRNYPGGIEEATSQSVTAGKTPLILVHGFDGEELVRQLSTSSPLPPEFLPTGHTHIARPGIHGSANSVWLKSLLSEPGITDKYDVYVFGYDFRERIDFNATYLESDIREVFGDGEVTFVSYSMGSNVVDNYLGRSQRNEDQTLDWIPVGSGFEGSPHLLCNVGGTDDCDSAIVNKEIFDRGTELCDGELVPADLAVIGSIVLSHLTTYPSIRQMAWQHGGDVCGGFYENNPFHTSASNEIDYSRFTTIFSGDPGEVDTDFNWLWVPLDREIGPSDGLFTCSSATRSNLGDCPEDSPFGNVIDLSGEANHTNLPGASVGHIIELLTPAAPCVQEPIDNPATVRYRVVVFEEGIDDLNNCNQVLFDTEIETDAGTIETLNLWQNGTSTPIEGLDGLSAVALNDVGGVVAETDTGGVLWQPKTDAPAGDLPYTLTTLAFEPHYLNNRNEVAGYDSERQAVRWDAGTTTQANS